MGWPYNELCKLGKKIQLELQCPELMPLLPWDKLGTMQPLLSRKIWLEINILPVVTSPREMKILRNGNPQSQSGGPEARCLPHRDHVPRSRRHPSCLQITLRNNGRCIITLNETHYHRQRRSRIEWRKVNLSFAVEMVWSLIKQSTIEEVFRCA